MALRSAVFLDRDDTLIANATVTAHLAHPGDLFDVSLVELLPTVAANLIRLKRAGFVLVVVTNQGAVARGYCTGIDVVACNERMRELLRGERAETGSRVGVAAKTEKSRGNGDGGSGNATMLDADVDAVYFCPYHPKGFVAPWNIEHVWRKPGGGMFLAAKEDLGLDLSRSWMIGDMDRDLESAVSAGIAKERALQVKKYPDSPGMSFAEATEIVLRGVR